MKSIVLLLVFVSCLIPVCAVQAQISNLTVNGATSNFTMVSGDTIRWEYNVPVGASTLVEVWFDINHDGVIQPLGDKLLDDFVQIDGRTDTDGPPDIDGSANGHVLFEQPVGLAPSAYVMRFSQGGSVLEITGTIQPLASPSHTISGHITPPVGEDAAYILVELQNNNNGGMFWHAVTDVNGDFEVQMGPDTSGNPWRLRVSTAFPPAVVSPEEILLTITGNHTGNNFTFVGAAAQVCGIVRDEHGGPIVDRGVYLWGQQTSSGRGVATNASGYFCIGVPAPELVNNFWYLGVSSDGDTTTGEMRSKRTFSQLSMGDSLYFVLTVYSTNAQIRGVVQVNGLPPGFRMELLAQAGDSLEAESLCDAATGAFTLHVYDQIAQYNVSPMNLPPNYGYSYVLAQPGDTNVLLSITATSVQDLPGTIPDAFTLQQNYPNPFNPSTTIDFGLPERARVRLRIFNLLGEEIAVLADGVENAGYRRVVWNAGSAPSGVYFCRLEGTTLDGTARTFSSVRKLVLTR